MNEMRKLMEVVKGIDSVLLNETDGSMSPEDHLRKLRSVLFELANLAARSQFYLRKSNLEFSEIAKEVEDQADRLRELIHSKL